MIALMIAAAAAACTGAPSLSPKAMVSTKLGAWVGITNGGDQAVVVCIRSPFWLLPSGAGTAEGSPHGCRTSAEKHLVLPGSTLWMKHLSAKPTELRSAIGVRFFVTEFSLGGAESDLQIECTALSIAPNMKVSGEVGSWAPRVVAADGLFHLGLKNTAHAPRLITEMRHASASPPRMRCDSGARYIVLPGDVYFQASTVADVEDLDELSPNKCLRAVAVDFGAVPALPRPP